MPVILTHGNHYGPGNSEDREGPQGAGTSAVRKTFGELDRGGRA
jgi:hypothetical protein